MYPERTCTAETFLHLYLAAVGPGWRCPGHLRAKCGSGGGTWDKARHGLNAQRDREGKGKAPERTKEPGLHFGFIWG